MLSCLVSVFVFVFYGNLVRQGCQYNSLGASIIFFFFNFIYLFLAALGLPCCVRAFSSCGEWGLLFVAVRGLCIALLLWSRGSRHAGFRSCGLRAQEHRLSSCGAWVLLLHGMWHLPGLGLEPVSPALAGGFLTTAPPGKSREGMS